MSRLIMSLFLYVLGNSMVVSANPSSKLGEWHFQALLDGKPIGTHSFVLSAQANNWSLSSKASFAVRFLFIKAYSYEHQANEQWQANCLQNLSAETNDNGEEISVRGKQNTDYFLVRNNTEEAQLPVCVMTFAYWNPAILTQSHLLNPQTGEYVAVQIERLNPEKLRIGNETVNTERYRLITDEQQITLWYATTDYRWLALETVLEDGYRLRYQLQNSIKTTYAVDKKD